MKLNLPPLSRFATAIFLGAFLLFQVQPLIARRILPWFGGGPSVWTACMLFFQCLLVGGYAYAHGLSRLPRRKQVIVHLALLLLSLPFLPIIPGNSWRSAATGDPTLRIMLLLACTVGLPYFVLSSASPLLQSWFRLSHPGNSPYRLYALSNAGALLALVSYPVIVEPTLFLRTQAIAWSCAYLLFTFLFAFCALRTPRGAHTDPAPAAAGGCPEVTAPGRPGTPGPLVCTLWAALPACGSVILLAVTNQMCCDVSVVPFLWVIPLSLYLLSFILCFESPRWYFRPVFLPLLLVAIAGMIALITAGVDAPIWLQITGFSAGAFVCFMVCHGETARIKPDPAHLTLFYLMLAGGGAAGGIFVGVVAPRIFTGYAELYIGLWACCALTWLALRTVHNRYSSMKSRWAARITAAAETVMIVTLAWVLHDYAGREHDGQIYACRNFYGTLRVMAYNTDSPARAYRTLQHGRIQHGAQFTSGKLRGRLTTYYGKKSGVGLAIRSFPAKSPLRVGIVGLGAGTIAAYGRPGDYYCFYEINPLASRLANEFFTYVKDCKADLDIAVGDARVSLERESCRHFDIIAVDAFTSDAIPVHLLTREAIQLYFSHMKSRGILAIHISNRYLNLEPVICAIADDLNIQTAVIWYTSTPADEERELDSSTWVLLARTRDLLDTNPIYRAASVPDRRQLQRGPVWTDDYNDLFRALVRGLMLEK